jgi:hypothetical protein
VTGRACARVRGSGIRHRERGGRAGEGCALLPEMRKITAIVRHFYVDSAITDHASGEIIPANALDESG